MGALRFVKTVPQGLKPVLPPARAEARTLKRAFRKESSFSQGLKALLPDLKVGASTVSEISELSYRGLKPPFFHFLTARLKPCPFKADGASTVSLLTARLKAAPFQNCVHRFLSSTLS